MDLFISVGIEVMDEIELRGKEEEEEEVRNAKVLSTTESNIHTLTKRFDISSEVHIFLFIRTPAKEMANI